MSNSFILRGGRLLSLDPATQHLTHGDVKVVDGIIAEIGETLSDDGLEVVDARGGIVMPGMIDTHRHTWQTQLRGICADWSLADYTYTIRFAISPCYEADDVYQGNYVGALEALNSGVTTILDFSHCNNTPAHADAAVKGLVDSGIRAQYAYGLFESDPAGDAFPDHASRIEDLKRVYSAHHGAGDGRITVGAALTEIGLIPWEQTMAEVKAAQALGAPIVTHTGCVWGSAGLGVKELAAHGLLRSDQVHVHCNALSEADFRLLAAAGAAVSISPETELHMGMGRLAVAQCYAHGIKPTLSCDVVSLNSGDLVTQARVALGYQRWADNEHLNVAGGAPVTIELRAEQAIEWLTINGAEALGLGDQVGSLTPGKKADIVVFAGDSFAFRSHELTAGTVIFQTTPTDVRDVFVEGKAVKRNGRLVGIDMNSVNERFQDSVDKIFTAVSQRVEKLPATPPDGFADLEPMLRANLSAAGLTA